MNAPRNPDFGKGSGNGTHGVPGSTDSIERLRCLLADRAVGELAAEDAHELDALLESRAAGVEEQQMERAAAALLVGLIAPGRSADDELPAHVRARLLPANAEVLAASSRESLRTTLSTAPSLARADSSSVTVNRDSSGSQRSAHTSGWIGRFGWMAAAAGVLLALVAWWPVLRGDRAAGSGLAGRPATGGMIVAATRSEVDRFVERTSDVVRAKWSSGGDALSAGVQGEVVWSAAKQDGFMVFRNLQGNNPSLEQFQLWIFDATRDERYPVHGGLFNVPQACGDGTEYIVRIDPKLRVEKAAAFVVTVERPGGVWVSDRSRVGPLAKLGS
jgi:hypothetical protein